MKKNVNIIKQSHAYRGYASKYNVEALNYFNHELQLKDSESVIKNKSIDLLLQLRGFGFVTTLVLLFKKQKMMM